MSFITSELLLPGTEMLVTMTGSDILIGTLTQCPAVIIFDNQSTVPVVISWDNVVWKTFTAGAAIVLDLTANNGAAATRTIGMGTSFFGNGASGNFSITYLYAKPN